MNLGDFSGYKRWGWRVRLSDLFSMIHINSMLWNFSYSFAFLSFCHGFGHITGNPLSPDILNLYQEPDGTRKLLNYMLDNLAGEQLSSLAKTKYFNLKYVCHVLGHIFIFILWFFSMFSAPRAAPPKTLDHSERARPNDSHRWAVMSLWSETMSS